MLDIRRNVCASEADTGLPRLLFVGSLDVAPTFGGPIQFHRHFVERQDFAFGKVIEPRAGRLEHLRTGLAFFDRFVGRLSRTRLFPYFVILNIRFAAAQARRVLVPLAKEFRPDAIVTVAFGSYGLAAPAVARTLEIPLITFFHDWWPDLMFQAPTARRFFDRSMKALYRQSDLALCVSEEMNAELGPHPNAQVLFPIGGSTRGDISTRCTDRPRVVYLGGMTQGYGRMLAALSRAYVETPGSRLWDLAMFGDTRDWPAADVAFATRAGIYGGQRRGPAGDTELSNSDILLIVMDFEEPSRRRVRTSFPSKLLDYCTYGKPVVAWAPSYSSIAGFARRSNFPLLVRDADPKQLVRRLDEWIRNSDQQSSNADAARALHASTFNPDRIHAELTSSIKSLLRSKGVDPAVPLRG